MARILITGITGFVGGEVARQAIELDHEVSGISFSHENDRCLRCDISDKQQVLEVIRTLDPEIIIHCAGIASVTKGSTIDYYQAHVVGTENIISALDALGGRRRLVLLSTAAVYGNQPVSVLHENLIPLPVSHYGMSKYVCERLVNMAAENHDITNLRLFNLIGPGQSDDFIVAKLVHHYQRYATSIRLGNIDTIRDFLDIHTAATRILDIAFNPKSYGETINLCSGLGYSIRQMLEVLDEITGTKMGVVSAPELIRKSEIWSLLGSTEKFESIHTKPLIKRTLKEIVSEIMLFKNTKE